MANTFKFGNEKWAVGKETVLAYNDENSNFKPLPFTFDRASTATVVNKDGLIETVGVDEPRIDFTDNTSGHLLLEPSRTNLVTYSEDLTATGWSSASSGTGISPTRTANYGISPDGTQNATRVQFDLNGGTTSSDLSYIAFYYTATGTATTNSVYMKSLSGTADVRLRCGSTFKEVDVTTEWQRFDLTNESTSDRLQVLLYGHLSSQTADLLIWGAQAETGSYATSIIKTEGSTVTRSAERANNAGNSTVFNDSEGVLYAEIAALADDQTNRRITISDGTNNNRIVTGYNTNSNYIFYFIIDGGSTVATGSYQLTDIKDYHKVGIKWKQNDFALWIDGVERHTDSSGTTPSGLDSLQFEQGSGGALYFYGKTKDLRVYDTALSDSELQALTS